MDEKQLEVNNLNELEEKINFALQECKDVEDLKRLTEAQATIERLKTEREKLDNESRTNRKQFAVRCVGGVLGACAYLGLYGLALCFEADGNIFRNGTAKDWIHNAKDVLKK